MNILQKIFTDHYEEIKYTLHPRPAGYGSFSKTMIICLLCPLLCGLFFFWKGAKGELSYKLKKENSFRHSLFYKLEFVSISFCMFWVSLLHNSYQATFWFCHLIRCTSSATVIQLSLLM